jgi:hypothetical protein
MKRFLLGALALIFSIVVSAATLVPVQLLNPAGSTSGQAIVSTGASTAPAWGFIGASGIGSIAANTVLANATGSSAAPTAFAMPSCSASGGTLQWTSGTGFTCVSNAFASPPSTGYGSTTPEPVAATTLSASGNDALMYQNSSAQSIPNATDTTVTGWTKVADRVNANFNSSTGVFTAPVTGYYQVLAQITFGPHAGSAGSNYQVIIVANGVVVAIGTYLESAAVTAATGVNVSANVSLTAGQTIVIQAEQNTGSAVALGSATQNFVSINRIP